MNSPHAALSLLAFADPASVAPFYVVNYGVMGGKSSSQVGHAGASLVFEGSLSLENNGGFASFRGPVSIPVHTNALLVRQRGDGQRYKLTLKHDDSAATAQYQAAFQSTGEWQTLRFRPGDFVASFRGRRVDAPPLEFGRVRTWGVLISDKQAGTFRLEIHRVSAE